MHHAKDAYAEYKKAHSFTKKDYCDVEMKPEQSRKIIADVKEKVILEMYKLSLKPTEMKIGSNNNNSDNEIDEAKQIEEEEESYQVNEEDKEQNK